METYTENVEQVPPVISEQAPIIHVEGSGEGDPYSLYRTILGRPGFLNWIQLVAKVKEVNATDIIFNNGRILIRIAGILHPLPSEFQPDLQSYEKALISVLPDERHLIELISEEGATDFGVTVEGMRMRGNVYRQLSSVNGVFRPIADKVLAPDQLMLDKNIFDIVLTARQGLILVTGATGSGKSATVVAMLEAINETCEYNVITVEDPIEYIFASKKSIFSQREVGQHATSFDRALRSALRQNPDVIFVGEIRDYPTMVAALKAAETGHLVFATLHTRRVYSTLNRLIQMAPAGERDHIRDALAQNFLLLLCQSLLRKRDGSGVVPCREIAIRNNAVIACISTGKVRDINNVMLGNRPMGMIDWNNALNVLVQRRLITEQEANHYRDRESDV